MRNSRPTPRAVTRQLFTSYEQYSLDHLGPANCKHQVIQRELSRLCARSGGVLRLETVGRSVEGRTINLVTCGSGHTTILLWSQMHGDESTATLALMDIFHFFVRQSARTPWLRRLLKEVTLKVVPMVNPDGAQRMRRHTAVHIDVNRDAAALVTPEAKALRNVHRRCEPSYAFNLHDQGVSSVGTSHAIAAFALLAPPVDGKNSMPPARKRAMRLAALIAHNLSPFIGGHITRYDDTFEPRAFGDTMQRRGTSTVLIESGHWLNDPDKAFIRKIHVAALTGALWAIATSAFRYVPLEGYTALAANGTSACDILIRDIVLEHPNGWQHPVDVGLTIAHGRRTGSGRDPVTIEQIGDLSTVAGLEVISGRKRRVASTTISIDRTLPFAELLALLHLPRTYTVR